jgi:hypothetical protein
VTKDEAEKARKDAVGLVAAVIKVAQCLDLTAEQTARAVLDALRECPKSTIWLEAIKADGARLLEPTPR